MIDFLRLDVTSVLVITGGNQSIRTGVRPVTTRTNGNIRTRPKLGKFWAKNWCDWDFGYGRRLGDLITFTYKSDFNETNLFSAQN